jgi:CRP-like cAMP-binding protein
VERVRALQQVALFRHTRGARLQGLAARCDERFLHAGEELLARGQPSGSLFVVLEGELDVAGEPARPGAGINPLAALEPSRSPAQVRAVGPARVLEVRSEELVAQLEQDFEFAQRLLVNLCELSRTGPLVAVTSREPGARGTLPDPPTSEAEKMLALNSVGPFRGLDEGVLGALAAHAEERQFAAGEDMVIRGELGTRMFVLFEGQARVHRSDFTLAEIDAPNVFGEGAAISPAPRDASVSATVPSRVLVLGREVLFELMREQPMVVRRMQQVLLKRALGAERLNVTVSDHVDFVASLIG